MKPGDRIFYQSAFWTVTGIYPGLHSQWIASLEDGEGAIVTLVDDDEFEVKE